MDRAAEIKRLVDSGGDLKEDFMSFAQKHLAGSDNMMAVVIVGHLYAEHSIDILLSEALKDITALKRFSVSQKIAVIKSMELLTPESLTHLEKLNTIRNNFAHNLDYTVNYPEVQNMHIPNVTKTRWDKDQMETMQYALAYISGHVHGQTIWLKDRKAKNNYLI